MHCTTTSTISSARMATANETPSGWHIVAAHVGDPVFFIHSCQGTFRYHEMSIPLYPSIDNGTESGKQTFYYPSLFVVDPTPGKFDHRFQQTYAHLIHRAHHAGSFISVERLMGDYFKISIGLIYDPPQLRSKAKEALRSKLCEVEHIIDVQPLPLEKAHFLIQYPIPLAELGVHCCDLTIPAFSSGCKVNLDVVVKGEKLAQETARSFERIPITAKVTYSALEVAPKVVPKIPDHLICQPRNEVTFTTSQLLHSPAFQELLEFGDQELARAVRVSPASGEKLVFAGQIDRATKGFHLAHRQQLAELYRAGKGENPDKAVREAGCKVDELARIHLMKKFARLSLWSRSSSAYFTPNDSPRLVIDGGKQHPAHSCCVMAQLTL